MLTVQKYTRIANGTAWFECVCDCGTIREVRGVDLRRGDVKSCGCGSTRGGKRKPISCDGVDYPSISDFIAAHAGDDKKKAARIRDRLKRGCSPEQSVAMDKGSLVSRRRWLWT
jgi:hypothetical protein